MPSPPRASGGGGGGGGGTKEKDIDDDDDDDIYMVHLVQDVELQSLTNNSPLKQTTNEKSQSTTVLVEEEESTFGAIDSDLDDADNSGINMLTLGDEELVNVSPALLLKSKKIGSIAKISLHSDLTDAPLGFDVCKEYGYKYEYTQEEEESDSDDDDNDSQHQDAEQQDKDQSSESNTAGTTKNTFLSKLSAAIATDNDQHHADNDSIIDTTNQNPQNLNYTIHLAGKSYHPIHDYATRREDESNLFWFTYRCDFPRLNPYNLTSDAGWGCMLRSAQMMLCQALRVHYVGRMYKPLKSTVQRRSQVFLQDLFMWMADFPSATTTGCFFSLHNMVAVGMARYETLPGEWFGPGTACYVMRDLVERQEILWREKYGNAIKATTTATSTATMTSTANKKVSSSDTTRSNKKKKKDEEYRRDHPPMRVYVAPEGCIYRQEVHQLMTKDSTSSVETQQQDGDNSETQHDQSSSSNSIAMDDPLSHPLSVSMNPSEQQTSALEETPEWDTSALILIPLRLGLKEFNASSYSIPLAHSFSLPQSVGFIGGSPRHALWFYAAQSDGKKLYGLDPHTVQKAPRRRKLKPNEVARTGNSKKYQVLLSDEYLRSVNCPNPSSMGMHRIDPSLALGFYCRDQQDFESFCSAVEGMKSQKKMKDFPALFSIADAKPDYTADVSSAMLDMMLGSSSNLDGDAEDNESDDDDDFVLL
jgi:cysteine protease ATG4